MIAGIGSIWHCCDGGVAPGAEVLLLETALALLGMDTEAVRESQESLQMGENDDLLVCFCLEMMHAAMVRA